MDKSMLIGVVAGVGIAVAGGVAGFALLDGAGNEQEQLEGQVDAGYVEQAPVAAPAAAPVAAPAAAQPRAPAEPARTVTAAAPPAPIAAPAEECWEEQVEVPAEPRDERAIAGTAAGAVIGGALADRLGDDDDLVTAAGAAAGAFIGRRAQREFQENRTTTTTVTRCGQR